MRSSILSLFAAASLALAQTEPAPVVANNPSGASFVAKLPTKEGSTLQGSVTAVSGTDGKGVLVSVAISGLPTEGGPFSEYPIYSVELYTHREPYTDCLKCTTSTRRQFLPMATALAPVLTLTPINVVRSLVAMLRSLRPARLAI